MINWATKKTAKWWVGKDKAYERYGHNQESLDYMQKEVMAFISILEIGSGTGRLINKLAQDRQAAALDINPYLIKLVKKGIKTYIADISEFQIPDQYELVYTYQVLQHLDHDNFLKALDNIKQAATKEIWLIEGFVANASDGARTHGTGSYYHAYQNYLDCYQIDNLDNGKIKAYRSRV